MQTVQIEVAIDDSGVVRGTRNIANSFDQMDTGLKKVGERGNVVLTEMTKNHERAHQAAQLLVRTTGVEMPRALETVIAQSKIAGPLLSAAFEASVAIAFVGALVTVAEKVKDVTDSYAGLTDAVKAFNEENIKANRQALVSFKTPLAGQAAIQDSAKREADQQKTIDYLKEAQKLRSLDVYSIAAAIAAHVQLGSVLEENTKTILTHNDQLKQEATLTDQYNQKLLSLNASLAQARAVGPFQQIAAEESAAMANLKFEYDRHIVESTQFGQEEALIHQTAAAKVAKAWTDLQGQLYAIRKAGAMKLLEDDAAAVSKQMDQKFHAQLDGQQKVDEKIIAGGNAIQSAETELAMERARISGNLIAGIIAQEQQRVSDTISGLQAIGVSETQIAKVRETSEQTANLRIYEEYKSTIEKMGNEFVSLWDDITSGNIGKRILDNFKTLVSQMIAQWALGSQMMRSLAQSTLGQLVFGPGSTTLGMLGAGGMLPNLGTFGVPLAGTAGIANGSTSLASMLGLGGGFAGVPGSTTIFGGGYQQTMSTAAGVGLGSPMGDMYNAANIAALNGNTGSVILRGVPGIGGISGLASPGGFSLSSIGGLLPMGAGMLGNMVGGIPGALGAAVGGSIGMAALGSPYLLNALAHPLVALGLGPAAAGTVLAGAGGGLIGFGVGQQYGLGAGIGSGVGSGALMGFALGGPVGAIVGGIVGLLGGLFGGLFGGSKRRKQAEAFAQTQEKQADAIEAAYKSFQVDYATATTQLEQIRVNAQDQLSKLKGEGRGVFSKELSPYIDKIEAEMKGYQNERDRRASLAFAPPQFGTGGTVMAWGYGTTNGGVPVIAHPGEEIINPTASARNRPLLKAINSGATPLAGDLHFHAPLVSANKVDASWLQNGGMDQIISGLKRARLEGRM